MICHKLVLERHLRNLERLQICEDCEIHKDGIFRNVFTYFYLEMMNQISNINYYLQLEKLQDRCEKIQNELINLL